MGKMLTVNVEKTNKQTLLLVDIDRLHCSAMSKFGLLKTCTGRGRGVRDGIYGYREKKKKVPLYFFEKR